MRRRVDARREVAEVGPHCVQCGGARTDPLGAYRYACRDCGAVASVPGTPPPVQLPRPATGLEHLAGTHPPRLLARLAARAAAGEAVETGTGRTATFARYADYDRFVSAARTSGRLRAEYDRTGGDVPIADVPVRMPPFSRVVSQLQARCLDARATVAGLGGGPLVAERVEHALRWLATDGREHCWLAQDASATADPAAVRELLADPLQAAAGSDENRRVLFAALFGTSRGPSLAGLADRFGADRVRAALAEHLRSGARPLRAELVAVLATAAAAPTGRPGPAGTAPAGPAPRARR